MNLRNLGLCLVAGFTFACDPGDPCDAPRTVGPLDETHWGWGSAQCAQCHASATLHQRTCGVDGAAINEGIDLQDPASCVMCHGNNGVDGW